MKQLSSALTFTFCDWGDTFQQVTCSCRAPTNDFEEPPVPLSGVAHSVESVKLARRSALTGAVATLSLPLVVQASQASNEAVQPKAIKNVLVVGTGNIEN